MSATGYAGIDYSLGLANVNKETGIHYGVIPQHEVLQAWCDSSEANYGDPTCPECGNVAVDASKVDDPDDTYTRTKYECDDYACTSCKAFFVSESAFGDEPISHSYEGDGYTLEAGTDGDIFVLASPYYTRAQYCSPCAPGAGYLTNPCEDGPKTYALGHEWFDDGKAPYPLYRVSDDSEV